MSGEYNVLGGGRNNPSPAVRLLILGMASLIAAAFLFLFRENLNESLLLVMLGILAMVGVFYLFASAIGFVEISPGKQSEDIGRLFADNMDEAICILDAKGNIVYSNSAYADLTGARGPEEIETPEVVLSRFDDAANAVYRLANSAIRGLEADEEFRLPHGLASEPSAAPRWFRASTRLLRTRQRDDPMRVWRLADISAERDEQEQTFLELQKAIDHLDQAPVGFFSADASGRIQYVNATLAAWLGMDLTSFQPGTLAVSDVVAGDGAAMMNAVRAEAGTSRTSVIDLELERADGVSLPVQLVHRVHADREGLVGPTRTIVINRAEVEGTSDDLHRSEVRFTRFFNSTPMAIAALDREGRLLRTNAPFLSLFGSVADSDAVEGQIRFASLLEGDAVERFEKAFGAARANHAKIEPFDAVLNPGPGERHLRVFVNAVAGPQGSESAPGEEAAIVYAMDTTEQKALENQMAQSQKMQAVGQLAGGIAHDFNNVLTAIIMASDLLLTNHRPSDPSFADIMNIKQNANRAASLVRQLLAFSRRQTLRPEVLTLTDVLADLRMLLSRLVGNNIDLQIEHGRDLWPVKADLGQFEQVIVNLAVNARDAMPEGGQLTIRTRNVDEAESDDFQYRGLEHGDYVLIEVEDTGTGIPPEVLEKIFEPFFTTKEVGKGTGLGLSMVYGIVKQTGGFIYCESVPGEGTGFRIFLPRHVADAGEEPVEKAVAAPEKTRDLSGTATVLLVEDEDAVRMGGVRALTSRGYTVHEASSGLEALDVMEELEGKVDIVVSDVVMPEMDGPTLLTELRKQHPDIKFIFVSGYAEDAFSKNLPADAKFGFLPKPFSLKQLATTVKEMLED